jgi:hypothetical protein
MLIENFDAKYVKGTVSLEQDRYANNDRIALLLFAEDGEPLATATTNLSDAPLADNEVILKGWSENTGIPDALIRAGVVGPALRSIRTGFVEATVHELLIAKEG